MAPAPAQVISVVEEEESKPEIAVKVLVAEEDTSLKCTNNCEDSDFNTDGLLDQQPTAVADVTEDVDVDVDVIGCTDTTGTVLAEADDPDATEYSSSFGGTVSEDDSRMSDEEVESQFFDDGICSNSFNGIDSLVKLRKKKLNPHWRKCIRPIMWRCKWIELRLKELQSQAMKYDGELAAYNQIKLDQYTSEGSGVRSLPFYGQVHRNRAIKRRKRVRIEEKVDIPSYMSYHNLFSYYENKRSDADGVPLDDDCTLQVIAADNNGNEEFDVNNEWPSLDFKDDDNSLEQVLKKIEVTQFRVQKLKTRVVEIFENNAGRISSMDNLSLLTQSDPLSSASPGNDDSLPVGALYSSPQHLLEFDIGDLALPESAVSSCGDATHHPDVIESKMGILSTTKDSLDHPQIGNSFCENIMDGVLIHNEVADKGINGFGKVGNLPIEKRVKEEVDEEIDVLSLTVPESDPTLETTTTQQQSVKGCSIADDLMNISKKRHLDGPTNINKRRRMERKRRSNYNSNFSVSVQKPSGIKFE